MVENSKNLICTQLKAIFVMPQLASSTLADARLDWRILVKHLYELVYYMVKQVNFHAGSHG